MKGRRHCLKGSKSIIAITSCCKINEHFELGMNGAVTTQIVFQVPVRLFAALVILYHWLLHESPSTGWSPDVRRRYVAFSVEKD